MRYAFLITLSFLMAACSSVTMRHPETGATVTCGPYSTGAFSEADAMRERQCIQDFKEQGFVRVAN